MDIYVSWCRFRLGRRETGWRGGRGLGKELVVVFIVIRSRLLNLAIHSSRQSRLSRKLIAGNAGSGLFELSLTMN